MAVDFNVDSCRYSGFAEYFDTSLDAIETQPRGPWKLSTAKDSDVDSIAVIGN